ncbi:dnaJ homolog subfamily C member 3b isoform X2 [Syngnathus scovelli]|uniref:dnaJ homolog subfamily C member 3b isoform X2 n=1 Tax=Syngnathus scovelli TaxID=161590 RepID=UPI00210F493A|nr:dnaJ homolog subfamily C member 3b isoform X2 [Syngnathus scovelli]
MDWGRLTGLGGVVCSLSLLCVILDLQLDGVLGATRGEIEHHLEMGRKLLAAGQLAEALSHYHSAVEVDSKNYLTYYKRGAVFLAMGKSRSALPDLTRAIQLKPDFLAARLQRGNILLKQGHAQEARRDFEAVLRPTPEHADARERLARARELEELQEDARAAYHRGNYGAAVSVLERIIEISPWDPEMRELRADCYLRTGEPQKAIQDLAPATRLRSDNRAAFLKLSLLHYSLGEHHESLNQVRECLKLDQDDKNCLAHYKQAKKLSKQLDSAEELVQAERYREAIEKYEGVMKAEPHVPQYSNLAKERICFCLVKPRGEKGPVQCAHRKRPSRPRRPSTRAPRRTGGTLATPKSSATAPRPSSSTRTTRKPWRTTKRRRSLTATATTSEKGWSEPGSCSRSPARETTTRFSESDGRPASRRSSRPTGSWRSSGTPTTSSRRPRRRRPKGSSSTLRRPRKSSPTQK